MNSLKLRPRPDFQPTVSVVIPALNEAENLRRVLTRLPADAEVIVVEDQQPDHSCDVIDSVRPHTRLICQTRRGKGNALACGFAAATSDIIVCFDADGSARPEEIDVFVSALLAGADFVKGTRMRPGGGSDDLTRLRSLGNRALTATANALLGSNYSDLCYGYNAFWSDVLPSLNLPAVDHPGESMQWGEGFEIETLLNCRASLMGLNVAEVPSFELARVHGLSNLNAWRDGRRVLRTLIAERWLAARSRHATGRRLTASANL